MARSRTDPGINNRFARMALTTFSSWKTKNRQEDSMSRNRNIISLAGASLVLATISVCAIAQGGNTDTATTRVAYFQVFTDPQDATCPNPRHRKVKTSKGYRWRWVC